MKRLLNNKRSLIIIGLAFLGAAATHWYIPYEQIELINRTFILKWFAIASLTGAIGVVLMKGTLLESSLLVTAGFIIAILIRVIFEVSMEPSSHSLWPFEILITIIIAFPSSMLGAFFMSLIRNSISDSKVKKNR